MQHEFTFTPEQVYLTILAIAGFVTSVTAAIKIIGDVIRKAKEPDELQNKRIESVEKKVEDIDERVKKLEAQQERAEEVWVLYMQALFDLINHELDGNHVDQLRRTRDEMQKFIAKNNIHNGGIL